MTPSATPSANPAGNHAENAAKGPSDTSEPSESTTPPLSRRQLREQQRQSQGDAPRQSAPTPSASVAPAPTAPEPTAPATGKPPKNTPSESTSSDGSVDAETDRPTGLTRRQVRLQRTASVDVVPAQAGTASAPSSPTTIDEVTAPRPTASKSEAVEPPKAADKGKKSKKDASSSKKAEVLKKPEDAKKDGGKKADASTKTESPSDNQPANGERDSAETTASVTSGSSSTAAKGGGDSSGPAAASPISTTPAVKPADHAPAVSSAFGTGILAEPVKAETPDLSAAPFDQIIARGIESADTSSNSLILPTLPSTGPLTGPINATGNIIVTGSIDLPAGLGSTGQHPQHFDNSDVDAMFDEGEENAPATAGTPVSASKAISTHTATRDVISPPAPAKSNRVLMILAITAGALAVAVLAVVIIGFAAGAFSNS